MLPGACNVSGSLLHVWLQQCPAPNLAYHLCYSLQEEKACIHSLRQKYSIGKSADLRESIASAAEIRESAEHALDTQQLAKSHMLVDTDSTGDSSNHSAVSPFAPPCSNAPAPFSASILSAHVMERDTSSASQLQADLPFDDPLRQSVDAFARHAAGQSKSAVDACPAQCDHARIHGCFACFAPSDSHAKEFGHRKSTQAAERHLEKPRWHRQAFVPLRKIKRLVSGRTGASNASYQAQRQMR